MKQPYRAPDALSFAAAPAETPWIESALSGSELAKVGVFDPAIVDALWKKIQARKDDAQLSNTDNMALVGVLSTQLLYRAVLYAEASDGQDIEFKTFVDRSSSPLERA